jgi:ribonucleoside-diphosphate reductase alpha chain
VADVADAYEMGWVLQLKAVALYRDGCKLSQPLSTGSKDKKTKDKEAAEDKADSANATAKAAAPAPVEVPGLRHGEVERPPQENDQGFKRTVTVFTTYGAEKVDIQVWEYDDGRPCEIFVGARKSGTLVDNFLKEIGKNYSRNLQLGMTLDELTRKLINEYGPLAGQTDHKYLKSCLGIQDLIGKLLRYEYFGETGFLSVKPDPAAKDYVPTRREYLESLRLSKQRPRSETTLLEFTQETAEGATPEAATPAATSFEAKLGKTSSSDPNDFLAGLGGDAPDCDQCGHTTVRNGACYKCLNCGNSMGCS